MKIPVTVREFANKTIISYFLHSPMKIFSYLFILSFFISIPNIINAQNDDEALKKIIAYDNDVNTKITEKKYHRHVIELNADKKDWGEAKGYSEKIECFFEITDSGEVKLVKIINVLEKGEERAVQSYLFDETETTTMCYSDFYSKEERVGQQGAYFGAKNIIAVSVNDNLVIGDNLTDNMVKLARNMYLKARKYKKMFITLLSVQLAD